MTPSHTTRRGKRYRYYVSQPLLAASATESDHGARLPAREIENAVLGLLHRFLSSPEQLLKAAAQHELPVTPAAVEQGAGRIAALAPQELRAQARMLITKVTWSPTTLHADLDLARLQSLVWIAERSEAAGDASEPTGLLLHRLSAPLAIRRRGQEMRLVIPAASASTTAAPAASLIKAIARSRAWWGQIVSSTVRSAAQIARAENLSPRYVNMLLALAFLSPKIVTAIVDGRQPPDLTLEPLLRNIPLK